MPRPRKKKLMVQSMLPIIEEEHGNISAIARRLKCSRMTIYNRIKESEKLAEALEDARESMLDEIEHSLYREALNEDNPQSMTAKIFVMKTRGGNRGFREKVAHEVTGKDGGPIINLVVQRAALPEHGSKDEVETADAEIIEQEEA